MLPPATLQVRLVPLVPRDLLDPLVLLAPPEQSDRRVPRVRLDRLVLPARTARMEHTNATTQYKFQADQQCASYCYLDGSRQLIQVTFAFSLVAFTPGENYAIELQGTTSTSLTLDSIYSFTLLPPPPPPSPSCTETLTVESYAFSSTNNVTLYLRNTGICNVSLVTYYVVDGSGNQYALVTWSGPTITPNNVKATTILIGSACPSCTLSGTAFSFQTGNSYTIVIVTSRNNEFRFAVTK